MKMSLVDDGVQFHEYDRVHVNANERCVPGHRLDVWLEYRG